VLAASSTRSRQVGARSREGLLDARHGGRSAASTITDPTGQPFKSAESFWKHVLHDGLVPGTRAIGTRPRSAAGAAAPSGLARAPQTSRLRTPGAAGLEIIFRPDPTIWDGRFANNGWLQELPKPLTKVTWDPTAWVSPQLAESRSSATATRSS
jgi:molybdopterin-containing oxidoreductase family iron-sulfur binding subunit